MNITSTGPTAAIPVLEGTHFLNIEGTFGNTSVTVEWSKLNEGLWTPLLRPDDTPIAATEGYNALVTISTGFIRFNATGGSGIDLEAIFDRS